MFLRSHWCHIDRPTPHHPSPPTSIHALARRPTAHYTEREKAAEEESWQEEDEDAFSFASGLGAGFHLPAKVRPILEEHPLYADHTAAGTSMLGRLID